MWRNGRSGDIVRRATTLVAAVLVTATATAAVAGTPQRSTRSARAVVTSYTASTTAYTSDAMVQGSGLGLGSTSTRERDYGFVLIALRPGDRYATVSLQDSTQRLVAAVVQQTTRAGRSVQLATFCGHTARSLRLVPGGGTLVVRPSYALCGSTVSVPTTGTVRAVFRS